VLLLEEALAEARVNGRRSKKLPLWVEVTVQGFCGGALEEVSAVVSRRRERVKKEEVKTGEAVRNLMVAKYYDRNENMGIKGGEGGSPGGLEALVGRLMMCQTCGVKGVA